MNKVLRATLVSAVVITTVIGLASFVLSFAALWDLATMAGVPRNLSWLWPVIVDGTILQATISVIALAQFDDQRSGRRFFWGVLITAALVSIGANAMHAFISDHGTLHPALSAAIATVAPVSLLAATHGLGILVRIPAGRPVQAPDRAFSADSRPHGEPEASPDAGPETPPDAEPETYAEPETQPRPLPEPVPTPIPVAVMTSPSTSGGGSRPHPDSRSLRLDDVGVQRLGDAEPLDEVDRWVLDEERAEDLYPVDAP